MKIALLDTETTGLLKPSAARLSMQPYITEMYCCVLDTENNWEVAGEYNHMLCPPVPLPEEVIKITGITQEMVDGKPSFADTYSEFAKVMTGVDMMVAHNLSFDKGIIRNELARLDKDYQFPWPRHQVCTVESSFHIKGYRLNLTKLHFLATGKGFNAHRAKDDVHAMVRSFFWLVQEGHISLENYE